MSSARLVFSSDGARPLASLPAGSRSVLVDFAADLPRIERLVALGVAPGATLTVLQTFPGIVFLCDQTELAVERDVGESILVKPLEVET
jgi:Fe2+ transport system protein FeoA